jgi:hypothetical protein
MTAGPTAPRGSAARTPLQLATARNDRGMQDLLVAVGNTAVDAARILLAENDPVVICTGFPVNGAPETDGPPGAFALADALRSLGKSVSVASWDQASQIFAKVRGDLSFLEVPVGRDGAGRQAARGAVVTIEVCGQCDDGSYRNMRGVDIGASAPRFESVFGTRSIVSVGDGGNEFGMGSAPDSFFRKWRVMRPVSTTQCLVPAAVSNYGAYAIIKELERASRQTLLPDPTGHLALIRALVAAGCVDGYTGQATLTVDGEDIAETGRLLDEFDKL